MRMTYAALADKLRAAYRAKAKATNDNYAEVKVHCYCGSGFEMNITCTYDEIGEDEKSTAFYVQFTAEGMDDDYGDFEMGYGTGRLKDVIADYYDTFSDVHEMNDKVEIDEAELKRLEEIADGQMSLFERSYRRKPYSC